MAGVEGRIALITGGGRGIGRATAELLASRGAQVMCVARSQQELAEVGLEYSVADLGTPKGCAHAVAETEQRLGPIEILVCNHGIGSARERVIWEQESDVWSETMRVNLDGPFHLSRLVLHRPNELSPNWGRNRPAGRNFECPEWVADSIGRCNTSAKSLCWRFKLQGLSWSFVELTHQWRSN